jgi:tRNA(Ile)-lysidine synthetase-like protein
VDVTRVISVDRVPAGAWAVGVSGGADSVALLELLGARRDLLLHVAHLDHETRAGESAADAEFVRELADRWALPCTIARRSDVERRTSDLPANRSARFRAARLQFFRDIIAQHHLLGVVLAHHADDQAETVLQRLLRGSAPGGLTGMSQRACVGGVTIIRPLLSVGRRELRDLLQTRGMVWREDSSNASGDQQRNRVRALLIRHPAIADASVELGETCGALVRWLRALGPELSDAFDIGDVISLRPLVAREALRRWLCRRNAPGAEITPQSIERLWQMASDRAAPARQHFPGGLLVRRSRGRMFVDGATGST